MFASKTLERKITVVERVLEIYSIMLSIGFGAAIKQIIKWFLLKKCLKVTAG